jgi:hypothetical protein
MESTANQSGADISVGDRHSDIPRLGIYSWRECRLQIELWFARRATISRNPSRHANFPIFIKALSSEDAILG